MGSHIACLSVNPATWENRCDVLCREMVLLAVNDVFLHQLVQLVKVEKGNHGIRVMLSVEISIPKKDTGDEVGPDRTCVTKAVGDLGHFAVGVLEVTNIVDDGVANEDRYNPPEEHSFQALSRLADSRRDSNVKCQLHESCALKFVHDTGFLGVVEFIEAPAGTRVVDSNTQG